MEINRGLKLSFRIIGGLLLLSAIVPLGIGIWTYSSTTSFLEKAESTSGEVVELVERSGSEGGSLFTPRIRFEDHTGAVHEFTSSTASNPPQFHIDERVEVLYDPERPQDFRTTDWFSLWGGPVLGFGLAASTVFFAALFAFLGPIILQGIISAFRKPESTGQQGAVGNEGHHSAD